MDSIIGSIIFEFIGASVKWVFNLINSYARGKEKVTFREIYDGKTDDGFHDIFLNGVSNIVVGLLFIMVFVWVIIWLGL